MAGEFEATSRLSVRRVVLGHVHCGLASSGWRWTLRLTCELIFELHRVSGPVHRGPAWVSTSSREARPSNDAGGPPRQTSTSWPTPTSNAARLGHRARTRLHSPRKPVHNSQQRQPHVVTSYSNAPHVHCTLNEGTP